MSLIQQLQGERNRSNQSIRSGVSPRVPEDSERAVSSVERTVGRHGTGPAGKTGFWNWFYNNSNGPAHVELANGSVDETDSIYGLICCVSGLISGCD